GAALAIAEALVRHEEEGAVAAAINLRNPNWSAQRTAEIVLAVDALGGSEEAAGVHIVVTDEVVGRAVHLIGSGLGGEADDAAAGLAVFGFEAVGVYGEFGDGLERRRKVRRLGGVTLPVGVDGQTVKRSGEGSSLSAAQCEVGAVFGLGN